MFFVQMLYFVFANCKFICYFSFINMKAYFVIYCTKLLSFSVIWYAFWFWRLATEYLLHLLVDLWQLFQWRCGNLEILFWLHIEKMSNWNIIFNNLRNYHILFSGHTTWELPSLGHYLLCLLELVRILKIYWFIIVISFSGGAHYKFTTLFYMQLYVAWLTATFLHWILVVLLSGR